MGRSVMKDQNIHYVLACLSTLLEYHDSNYFDRIFSDKCRLIVSVPVTQNSLRTWATNEKI